MIWMYDIWVVNLRCWFLRLVLDGEMGGWGDKERKRGWGDKEGKRESKERGER